MSDRIEVFDVTIPAATLTTAPQTTNLSFNEGIVESIEILIPPGPSGLVGFRILHSQGVVIPYDSSKWIVADNEVVKWPIANFPTGSAWAITAYNTDVYDHTLYLRFLINETPRSGIVRAQLVPIGPGGTAEDFEPAE